MKGLTEHETKKLEKLGDDIQGIGKNIRDSKWTKIAFVGAGCLLLLGIAGVGFRVAAYMMQGYNSFNREWNKK